MFWISFHKHCATCGRILLNNPSDFCSDSCFNKYAGITGGAWCGECTLSEAQRIRNDTMKYGGDE